MLQSDQQTVILRRKIWGFVCFWPNIDRGLHLREIDSAKSRIFNAVSSKIRCRGNCDLLDLDWENHSEELLSVIVQHESDVPIGSPACLYGLSTVWNSCRGLKSKFIIEGSLFPRNLISAKTALNRPWFRWSISPRWSPQSINGQKQVKPHIFPH